VAGSLACSETIEHFRHTSRARLSSRYIRVPMRNLGATQGTRALGICKLGAVVQPIGLDHEHLAVNRRTCWVTQGGRVSFYSYALRIANRPPWVRSSLRLSCMLVGRQICCRRTLRLETNSNHCLESAASGLAGDLAEVVAKATSSVCQTHGICGSRVVQKICRIDAKLN